MLRNLRSYYQRGVKEQRNEITGFVCSQRVCVSLLTCFLSQALIGFSHRWEKRCPRLEAELDGGHVLLCNAKGTLGGEVNLFVL